MRSRVLRTQDDLRSFLKDSAGIDYTDKEFAGAKKTRLVKDALEYCWDARETLEYEYEGSAKITGFTVSPFMTVDGRKADAD